MFELHVYQRDLYTNVSNYQFDSRKTTKNTAHKLGTDVVTSKMTYRNGALPAVQYIFAKFVREKQTCYNKILILKL